MAALFGPTPTKIFSPEPEESSDDSSSEDNNKTKAQKRSLGTPKMDTILIDNHNITTGYYGGLQFLDDQKDFKRTFGQEPELLPTNPIASGNTSNAKLLLDFSEQCRLDVYLHAYRKFYVVNNAVGKNISTS